MRTVAIIGGGCSGVAVAASLVRLGPEAVRAIVVEASDCPGLGVAYGTKQNEHLLNVPAGRMSAFHDDAEHLLRWLRQNGHGYAPADFIPRQLYGAYLRPLLGAAIRTGAVAVRQGRCTRVERDGRGMTLMLDDGTRLHTDAVVLPLGNGTPAPLRVTGRDGEGRADARVIQNPWADARSLPINPASHAVIVGTGLTAVDVVLTLDAMGHTGPITAISRRGLLPRSHAPVSLRATEFSPADLVVGRSARAALRAVREACERETEAGGTWRTVIDSLRPHTAEAWKGWSIGERRAFCRFLRPFWDVHRHRTAPSNAARIDSLLSSGRLRVLRGGVDAIEATDAGVIVTASGTNWAGAPTRPILADLVINCTGPSTDPSRWGDPLVNSLLQSGLAHVDELGLGLETDEVGRVINRAGGAASNLFAIGPLCRPHLWESVAVPEIRVQAATICEALVGGEVVPLAWCR